MNKYAKYAKSNYFFKFEVAYKLLWVYSLLISNLIN